MDQTGAVIPGALAEVRGISTGRTRRVSANAAGQFNLAGLPAGDYEIQVSSTGFRVASRRFNLVARDRAVASVVLEAGEVNEVVEVDAATLATPVQAVAGGAMGGIAGGVIGGVPGGVPSPGLNMLQQMGQAGQAVRFARTNGEHLGTGKRAFFAAPMNGPVVKEAIAPGTAPHVLPISPKRSTSIHKSSPTRMALPPSLSQWPIRSPLGAWP